jgi:probable HAF family extracellular repeat protein
MWNPTARGASVFLGDFGVGYSCARAINNNGKAVGYALTPDGADHACSWAAVGQTQDLGTLGGRSYACALNDSDWIVGNSENWAGEMRAFYGPLLTACWT